MSTTSKLGQAKLGQAKLAGLAAAGLTVAIGLATEADEAFSATPFFSHQVGQAPESDLARPFRTPTRVGQATESDEAQAMGRVRSATLGRALEADLAGALAVLKDRRLKIVNEFDFARPFRGYTVGSFALALEGSRWRAWEDGDA